MQWLGEGGEGTRLHNAADMGDAAAAAAVVAAAAADRVAFPGGEAAKRIQG